LPTLIEAAGGNKIQGIDGKSMLKVFLGKTDKHRKYVFGCHNNKPDGSAYPVRSVSDRKYKLIHNLLYSNVFTLECVMTWEEMKYWTSWIHQATFDDAALKAINRYMIRPEYELYDIENDPYEMNNLFGSKEYEDIIQLLQRKLNEWMISQHDPGITAD